MSREFGFLVILAIVVASPALAASPQYASVQSQENAVIQQMSRTKNPATLQQLQHQLQALKAAEEQLKRAEEATSKRRPQ